MFPLYLIQNPFPYHQYPQWFDFSLFPSWFEPSYFDSRQFTHETLAVYSYRKYWTISQYFLEFSHYRGYSFSCTTDAPNKPEITLILLIFVIFGVHWTSTNTPFLTFYPPIEFCISEALTLTSLDVFLVFHPQADNQIAVIHNYLRHWRHEIWLKREILWKLLPFSLNFVASFAHTREILWYRHS